MYTQLYQYSINYQEVSIIKQIDFFFVLNVGLKQEPYVHGINNITFSLQT